MRVNETRATTGCIACAVLNINLAEVALDSERKTTLAVSAYPVNGKGPLTIPVSGPLVVGAKGLEPLTPCVSSRCSSQLS